MAQEVLERIKKESEPLYDEVLRVAGKKWDIVGFEKISPEMYELTVAKIKKPEKTMKVKCLMHNHRWFLVGDN